MLKPAIESAKRLVVRPADIGFTAKDQDRATDALPPVVALGARGGKLFLRFSAPIPAESTVVEAYVVLRRSSVVDDDPIPVDLSARRIVEPWTAGAVAWGRQPRLSETRAPVTTVEPGAGGLVRLDVRDLVRGWARHDPADQGIAIVADGESPTGTRFALSALGIDRESSPVPASPRAPARPVVDPEPYLELYLR
jgi:hypothetical protein